MSKRSPLIIIGSAVTVGFLLTSSLAQASLSELEKQNIELRLQAEQHANQVRHQQLQSSKSIYLNSIARNHSLATPTAAQVQSATSMSELYNPKPQPGGIQTFPLCQGGCTNPNDRYIYANGKPAYRIGPNGERCTCPTNGTQQNNKNSHTKTNTEPTNNNNGLLPINYINYQ